MGLYDNQTMITAQQAGVRGIDRESQLDSTWTEIKNAVKRETRYTGILNSESKVYGDIVEREMYNAGMQADLIRMDFVRRQQRGELVDVPSFRSLAEKYETEIVKAGGKSLADIDAEAKEKIENARKAVESAMQRSDSGFNTVTGSLAGAFRASLEDPSTLLTAFIGGGVWRGGSLIKAGLSEAGIQGVIGGTIGASTVDANKQWLGRLGIEPPEDEVVITAAAAATFGAVAGFGGAGIAKMRLGKAMKTLDDALRLGEINTEQAAKARELVRTAYENTLGFQFTPGQSDILRQFDSANRIKSQIRFGAPDNMVEIGAAAQARYGPSKRVQQERVASGMEAAEAKVNGQSGPQIDEALERLDLVPSHLVDSVKLRKAADELEVQLRARRQGLESGAAGATKKSARLAERDIKKLEKNLRNVKNRLARAEAKAEEIEMDARRAVELADENAEDATIMRAMKERQIAQIDHEIKQSNDALRVAQKAASSKAGKSKAARQSAQKRLAQAKEQRARLTRERKEVESEIEKYKQQIKDSAQAKRDAERALNDLYETKAGVDEINKTTSGYKWKVPKTDKGEPRAARPVIDSRKIGDGPDEMPPRKQVEDGEFTDDVSEEVLKQQVDDMIDRIDTSKQGVGQALGDIADEIKTEEKNLAALEDAINCGLGK